jgi:hypothetical protein
MRVAVMGTGGVGGYFGALLARAGHQVVFARMYPWRGSRDTGKRPPGRYQFLVAAWSIPCTTRAQAWQPVTG